MTVKARYNISTGAGKDKLVIPKGTQGTIIAFSNSTAIAARFPNLEHKIDGWFYIVRFPEYIDEILCLKEQLDLT
jgi:hypothetical protein